MASKVQICNLALTKLSASTITSLTDGTREAKNCNVLFDHVVDQVLIEGSWATATRRASLNATTNTPSFGFSTEYQLPTNPKCLKVLAINDSAPFGTDFRVEGDKLLTDASSIKIRYIARITDTESFGPHLTGAVVARLAMELSYTVTAQVGIYDRLAAEYQEILTRNLGSDNQQGASDITDSSDLIDVRL
jgi:hypothetical protein